jgi:hypothetical protein
VGGGIPNRGKTYDCAGVIDRRAVGARSAKRAEVRHFALGEAEGVRGQVIFRVALSGDLIPVVDRV